MSKPFYANNQVILAAIETVYNTAPSFLGAVAMQTQNISMKPTFDKEDRNNMNGMMGAQGAITISQFVDLSFDVELSSSGVAGVAPAYALLLKACGLAETVSVDSVIYTPIDGDFPSITIWWRNGGIEYKATGTRGSVKLDLSAGKIPKASFTFKGLYNDPTAGNTKVSADLSAFKNPIGVMKATSASNLMGYAIEQNTLTFDMANQVEYFNYVNLETVDIVNRKSSMNLGFKTHEDQYVDLMQRIKDNEFGDFAFSLGKTAGGIITLDVPQMQVKSSPDLSWDKETAHLGLEAAVVPVTRNSDFSLIYS